MSKRKDGGWQQAGGIMESKNENVKVPLISKIAYGFGDVGCNFSWMFVSNFLMIFYTDVFGISMAAVSALMLFSRFWDAIIPDCVEYGCTQYYETFLYYNSGNFMDSDSNCTVFLSPE